VNQTLTIPAFWLTFLVGTGVPFVVDLVTRRFAASAVKSIALTVLSVIGGWLSSLNATNGSFELKPAFTSVVLTFVTALASHQGLWSSLKLTGDNGLVNQVIPLGIGAVDPQKDPSTPSTSTPAAGSTAEVGG
jgi:hypothetical protein